MKKFVIICSMFGLLLCASQLHAQDQAEALQQSVEQQTMELRKIFNLNDPQTKQLYSAIYKREKTLNFTDYSTMSKQEKIDFLAQVNDEFKQSVSGVLTEEQFKKYAEWLEKKSKVAHE